MDTVIAKTPKPRAHLKGETPNHVNELLNNALNNMELNLKDCEDFSLKDLNGIQKVMAKSNHDDFNDIYSENSDNRKKRFLTMEKYEESWEIES